MRRIISIFVVACSTTLCAATAALWGFILISPRANIYDISIAVGNIEFHPGPSTPIWIAPLLFGVLPFLYGRRRIRNRIAVRRRLKARCTICGYDLRATPDRCPECGNAITATTT